MQNSDYERANSVTMMTDPFDNTKLRVLVDALAESNGDIAFRDAIHELFDPWVQAARQMAAGIKRHVEEGGNAGTHAYDLLAASETEHAKTTETLIEMVAATVLHKLIQDEGGGRANVSFSPADMDEMHKLYEIRVNRDGMLTDIHLEPRPTARASLKLSHDREGLLEIETAKPQAVARPEEPNWFATIGGERRHAADRHSAENAVRLAISDDPTVVAEVENRRCPQSKCPAPTHIDNCMAAFCPNKAPK